jgi:eukaryotic-like serine/threonine-protein kinase
LGLGVLVSVAFTIWKLQPREPDEIPLPTTSTPAPNTTTSAPIPNPPSNTPTPTPTAKADEPTADAPKAALKDTPRPIKPIEPSKAKETLSPEAARDLDEAEAALDAGKPADAVRLAQHSLYAQKTSRAYAVITRARCAQGDLGNAKAALAQVSARDRSPVVRACGKLGVELR